MSESANYSEVLTLINRRRRAVRSLESVCTFVASIPESAPETVLTAARELVSLIAHRYGCTESVQAGPAPREDPDRVYLALGGDECLTVSGLPIAADERREVTWCLAAAAAGTLLAQRSAGRDG